MKAVALRLRGDHEPPQFYYTYREGGDGFGEIGPLTRLWPDEAEWGGPLATLQYLARLDVICDVVCIEVTFEIGEIRL